MDRESVEKRPAILLVGSPNVGKRTLLSRKSTFSLCLRIPRFLLDLLEGFWDEANLVPKYCIFM